MIIPSGKKHVVWARIAKTGSMSTERTLTALGVFMPLRNVLRRREAYKPNKHILVVDDLGKLADVGVNVDDCFIFTIVRSPYSRAMSAWCGHTFFKEKNRDNFADCIRNPPQRPDKGYRELGNKKEKAIEGAWRHFTKTMSQSTSIDGALRVDRIIKLEDYKNGLTAVLEELGFKKIKFFKENKSRFRKKRDLKPEEIRLINANYSEDFDNFKYEKKEG